MNNKRAFTLVELLIVLLIVGVLIGIAVPAVQRNLPVAKQTAFREKIDTLNILRTYDQFKLAFATNITIEEFKKQLTQDIQIDKLQKVATTYPELNNNYVSFTQVIEYLQELSKAQDIRAIADGIHKILDYIISTISSKEEQAQKQTGFLDNYITMKIQTFSL